MSADSVPPAIVELMRLLPPPGSIMSSRTRELHRIVLTALIELIYGEEATDDDA